MNCTATPTRRTDSCGTDSRGTATTQCTASDVLRWAALPDLADAATDQIVFPMRRVASGRALIREGQPFERLHLVGSGSFKCIQTDAEGYEQVLAFAIHGDILGLDGLGQPQHTTGAVALEDSSVVALPFQQLLTLSRTVPALEALLHHAAGAEVLSRGDTHYLMSAPGSEVRVARFLLQLSRRQAALGYSDRRLRMRMTRRDIADYLGVAHETVSRALTALAQDGCIQLSQRDVDLVDLGALREVQRVTRGRPPQHRRSGTTGQASWSVPRTAQKAPRPTLQ